MCQNLSGISIPGQDKATALHPAPRALAPPAGAEPGAALALHPLSAPNFPET